MKIVFYKIEFKLASPLALSIGQGVNTDKDVMVDSKGRPFIPGTSLAGVYRSRCDDNAITNNFFGYVDVRNKTEKTVESKIKVYDATIKDLKNAVVISNRDCVALDEWKTAIKGCKFDFEVAEPGTEMITYIEVDYSDKVNYGDEEITNRILGLWKSNELSFGAKTSRGYGRINVVKIYKREFDSASNSEAIDQYTSFSMYEKDGWENITEKLSGFQSNTTTVTIKIRLRGGISIRKYSTDVNTDGTSVPDYSQLTYHNGIPTIPGTSWAGAFRHRIKEFTSEDVADMYFGNVKEKKTKSQIVFSETSLSGGTDVIMTRNAIDRFTGGTVDGALYTEKTHYGGTTELTIQYPKDAIETFVKALAYTICDLSYGFLAVGGLTSVGRGLFEVNGFEVKNDSVISIDSLLNSNLNIVKDVK